MTAIAISGALGRMGQRIISLVSAAEDLVLTSALEVASSKGLGRDIGALVGVGDMGVLLSDTYQGGAQVLVDFSLPGSTMERIAECIVYQTAILIGTTGFEPDQMDQIRAAAESIPVLIAPNMSVGVNVMFKFAAEIAKALGDGYDIEITETHHRFKKDAPSGTALKLAQVVADATDRSVPEDLQHGRCGIVGLRSAKEIGIHALRSGDVVGEHVISFGTLGERIEIVHRAHSRDTFALGSIRAARFLADKTPGLYRIEDALGL